MSGTNADTDDFLDDDPTQELPVLDETVVLDPAEHAIDSETSDETIEHTARFPPLEPSEQARLEELHADLAARNAKIGALERDIEQLTARWKEVDRHLSERDTTIAELTARLARAEAQHEASEAARGELQRALEATETELAATRERLASAEEARERSEREFAARLAELGKTHEATQEALRRSEQQRAELQRELEDARRSRQNTEALLKALREEHAKLQTALAEERREKDSRVADIASLRSQLAEAAKSEPEAHIARLQEEVATLSGYIASRRDRWNELEARHEEQQRRITELEHEVRQRVQRQERAEETAAAEAARAARLQAELTALRRVRPARSAWSERGSTRERPVATVTASPPHTPAFHVESEALADLPDTPPADDTSVALQSELEAERARLREMTTALAASEARAAEALVHLEELRQQLATARAEQQQARQDLSRLERALVDKDRALEVRDEHIRTLQNELDQRVGALQKLDALDLTLQGLDTKMSERLRNVELPMEPASTPTLVCLTSDVPRHYPLDKATLTIGRGTLCDIQISTQFVSREHARLTVEHGKVFIEDLGSTNGVFVNSVRVDRHQLEHSDLITIGETQFRFLEQATG